MPTPEHYLPFVVAYGAGRADEKPAWIWRGYEYGSISRRAMAWR